LNTGTWAANQPNGTAVEHFRFPEFPGLDEYDLQRYDLVCNSTFCHLCHNNSRNVLRKEKKESYISREQEEYCSIGIASG
jgi:hypothetical protein